jgi:hypothetical protein
LKLDWEGIELAYQKGAYNHDYGLEGRNGGTE